MTHYGSTQAMVATLALIATLMCGTTFAEPADDPQSALAEGALAVDGGWKPDGKPSRPAAWWVVDLHREGESSLRGRVMLSDSPLANIGNIDGQIDGSQVAGTIKDDAGVLVANFTGTISEQGFAGQYVDRSGETGEWRWSGTAP